MSSYFCGLLKHSFELLCSLGVAELAASARFRTLRCVSVILLRWLVSRAASKTREHLKTCENNLQQKRKNLRKDTCEKKPENKKPAKRFPFRSQDTLGFVRRRRRRSGWRCRESRNCCTATTAPPPASSPFSPASFSRESTAFWMRSSCRRPFSDIGRGSGETGRNWTSVGTNFVHHQITKIVKISTSDNSFSAVSKRKLATTL